MATTLTLPEPASARTHDELLPGRLSFQLPDFCRVLWASARAREVWETRVTRITEAWVNIERWSVIEGVRPSALQLVSPDRLMSLNEELAPHALVAVPIERTAEVLHYSQTPSAVTEGKPWVYRVAITAPGFAAEWMRAWRERDDETIGTLLGYPGCCRRLFCTVWSAGLIDTTWPMVRDVDRRTAPGRQIVEVSGRREANILLRWLGVRLVSHLPCSFTCAASADLGARLAAVGRAHGFDNEMRWCEEMLEWPVEWSALHGIAEIKTPVCKLSTRTDATGHALVVRRPGPGYPDEGATGNAFPYQPNPSKALTDTRAYKDAFVSLASLRQRRIDETEWADNGFAERRVMELAHTVVSSVAPPGPLHVLDLGCGNGRLAQIMAGGGVACGVEADPERASRANRRGVHCVHSDLARVSEWPAGEGTQKPAWDVVILMPGRLIETPQEQSAAVREALLDGRTRTILVYAYGDWITRYGSLEALCRAAGLPWTGGAHASGDGVEAALIDLEAAC